MAFGGQSQVAPLLKALIRRPSWNLEGNREYWRETWGYDRQPDLGAARTEHDRLARLLQDWGVEVHYVRGEAPHLPDSVFTYDQALITDQGALVLRSGKPARLAEADLVRSGLQGLGVPIVHQLEPPLTADGGDFCWLGEDLLLAGRSLRTNAPQSRGFVNHLRSMGVTVRAVPIPYWAGPGDVMHLMSLLSPVDRDLAVAYRRLLSVETVEFLENRGIELIDVPDEEFDGGLGANVLAVSPRKCIMLEGYDRVRRALEARGIEVRVFAGRELSGNMKGGPTCLVLPLLRAACEGGES